MVLVLGAVRRRGGLLLAAFVVAVQLLALAVIVAPSASAAGSVPSYGGFALDDDKGAVPLGPPSKWAGVVGGLGVAGTAAAEVGAAGGAAEAGAAGGLICATGIGCAVVAGIALGAVAYATRDSWMPWLSKHLTGGTKLPPNPGDVVPSATVDLPPIDPANPPRAGDYQMVFSPTGVIGAGAAPGGPYWAVTAEYVAYTKDVSGVVHRGTGVLKISPGNVSSGPKVVAATGLSSDFAASDRLLYVQLLPSSDCLEAAKGTAGYGCNTKDFYDWPLLGIDNTYEAGKVPSTEDLQWQVQQVCWSAALGASLGVSGGTADAQGVTVPACPAGSVPSRTTVSARLTNADPWTKVLDQDWTKDYQPKPDDRPEGFPDCFDATGHLWSWDAPQACGWEVHIDGKKCVRGNAACVNWTQVNRVSPSRVECWYGPYLRPTSECFMLERAYELTAVPVTKPDTDGDPDTKTDPTADPDPSPSPSSSASPSTSPSTATDPGSSPTPTEGGPIPGPKPPEATPDEDECWPSGWGLFNPASWVLRPTKCALKWAFLPDTTIMTQAGNDATNDLTRVGLGPLIVTIGDAVGGLGGSGAGCDGPGISFDMLSVHKDVHPFSACSAPMSTVAGFVYALTVVTVGVGGAMAVLRAFGIGFSFPFSMGKGSGDDG